MPILVLDAVSLRSPNNALMCKSGCYIALCLFDKILKAPRDRNRTGCSPFVPKTFPGGVVFSKNSLSVVPFLRTGWPMTAFLLLRISYISFLIMLDAALPTRKSFVPIRLHSHTHTRFSFITNGKIIKFLDKKKERDKITI